MISFVLLFESLFACAKRQAVLNIGSYYFKENSAVVLNFKHIYYVIIIVIIIILYYYFLYHANSLIRDIRYVSVFWVRHR